MSRWRRRWQRRRTRPAPVERPDYDPRDVVVTFGGVPVVGFDAPAGGSSRRWASMTPDEILADLNGIVEEVVGATRNIAPIERWTP